MKKLLLLSVVLFALAGCSKDETTDSGGQAAQDAAFAPHIYGVAMLENPAPETRGVANAMKVWSKPMAANNLTVKFLNGTDRYKAFVKEVAKEWEKAAGVRFIFIDNDKPATIRVGFDYVPGMMSSWALTGTDHMQVYGQQTDPTVHFAQWRRASDSQKRSDVLRAFGQVLGLELEFRHPNFYPAWITNTDGTVNEAAIKEYWENELADCITWAELKKIVLEPLSNQAFFINKTDSYDQESVMNWPFYEMIARNIPPIEFDEDYKTELSTNDIKFMQSLYGESFGEISRPEQFFPLIEFEFTGKNPYFTVTTTKNLEVRWDNNVTNESTQYDLPTDTTSRYTVNINHSYSEAKTRKIVIGEVLEYGQEMPSESYALTKFDFTGAELAGKIDIKKINQALSYIRIVGGSNFTSQEFNFTGYDYLKELYLVRILNSKVVLDNCPNLEKFATSMYIWKPSDTIIEIMEQETNAINRPPIIKDSLIIAPIFRRWPYSPEPIYSISDARGGLTILNCKKIKEISLEHTCISNFNVGNLPVLEYIYLSSSPLYIVGGGTPKGKLLLNVVNKLNLRRPDSKGLIVLRGIPESYNISMKERIGDVELNPSIPFDPAPFDPIPVDPYLPVDKSNTYQAIIIDKNIYNSISQELINKNWEVSWNSQVILW